MSNSRKGLTLLEIIAAVLIMAFGIVPIMRFAPTILQVRNKMDRSTQSVFLSMQKIEELRGRILADFYKEGGYGEAERTFPQPHDDYRYSVEDDLSRDIKTISVSVWHADNPGDIFTLYTKIASRGVYKPTDRVANFSLYKSYHLIQDAVNEARRGDEIRALVDIYIENVIVNTGIKLSGGWSADFISNDSFSTVNGSIEFIGGESEIEGFVIE